ncbi:hypothetical protein BN946_scf185001.g24 [Trametes cinnabarina]|uniref:Uncharacterized protein n=1 Tax=Pycnoporus cinnabarinus TaxID=5643 RepID=A0A060SKQ3_PYCCI|nr:hypothetical protein BN946_scf185001.g24 [Trametes cinnabarina]
MEPERPERDVLADGVRVRMADPEPAAVRALAQEADGAADGAAPGGGGERADVLLARVGGRETEQIPQRLDGNPPLPSATGVGNGSSAVSGEVEENAEDELPEYLRPEMWVEGEAATEHVRDSLRNDTGYVTSFLSAGWTNDQITIGNLIYLGMITGRVPILPPFTSYIDAVAQPLPFSEIFDVPRLVRAIDSPVLEWHIVKDLDLAHAHASRDHIGCWNIWEVDNVFSDGPRGNISYTRAPPSVKLIPGYEHDSHSSFWSLAKLAFPQGRADALAKPDENPTRPSEGNQVVLPPDEQLLCYDYLYYVCALEVRAIPHCDVPTPRSE